MSVEPDSCGVRAMATYSLCQESAGRRCSPAWSVQVYTGIKTLASDEEDEARGGGGWRTLCIYYLFVYSFIYSFMYLFIYR